MSDTNPTTPDHSRAVTLRGYTVKFTNYEDQSPGCNASVSGVNFTVSAKGSVQLGTYTPYRGTSNDNPNAWPIPNIQSVLDQIDAILAERGVPLPGVELWSPVAGTEPIVRIGNTQFQLDRSGNKWEILRTLLQSQRNVTNDPAYAWAWEGKCREAILSAMRSGYKKTPVGDKVATTEAWDTETILWSSLFGKQAYSFRCKTCGVCEELEVDKAPDYCSVCAAKQADHIADSGKMDTPHIKITVGDGFGGERVGIAKGGA